jgi:hypothetical protein
MLIRYYVVYSNLKTYAHQVLCSIFELYVTSHTYKPEWIFQI